MAMIIRYLDPPVDLEARKMIPPDLIHLEKLNQPVQ